MRNITTLFLILVATAPSILAQTAEELRTASHRLRESANALPQLQSDQDQETVAFIKLLSQSHSLTLTTLSNYRIEQPNKLTDTFLKSCKMIANQTEKLVLLNATVGKSLTNQEAIQKLKELNTRCVDIYKLLSPALMEFDRRQLKLE